MSVWGKNETDWGFFRRICSGEYLDLTENRTLRKVFGPAKGKHRLTEWGVTLLLHSENTIVGITLISIGCTERVVTSTTFKTEIPNEETVSER